MQKEAIGFLKRTYGTEEEIASILINIGLLCPNNDSAMYYYKSAIEMAKTSGLAEIEIAGYNNLAYCYLDKKDYMNARICLLDLAIPLALNENKYDWLATLYDSYADVAYGSGNPDLAYQYEKKASAAKESADKIKAADQVRLLATLIDEKNNEIKIRNKEKEIVKKENRNQWLIFWIMLLLLLFLSSLIVFIRKMQLNKLRDQRQKLDSARQLIALEENFKGKVARELHDMISPIYTFVSSIKSLPKSPDLLPGKKIESKLTNIAETIRHLSHRLDRVWVEQDSFEDLVKGICEDLQQLTNVPVKLTLDLKNIEIPVEPATHLLRIIQELLLNAVKYVKSGSIEISVNRESVNLYIRYRDEGPGFDRDTGIMSGLGLVMIFERVKVMGGEADLETGQGKGTSWRISVPINHISTKKLNSGK